MAVSRALIDSHVFLWLLQEPHKIGKQTLATISSGNEIYISVVSIWELAIKYSQDRLDFSPAQLLEAAESSSLLILQLNGNHVIELPKVVTKHADPFDKMLLAQSLSEKLPLFTADTTLLSSKFQTIDARK